MTIRISAHAQKRLLKRRLSMEDIESIVENPEDRVERDDGCCEYTGMARDGRRFLVVLDDKQEPPTLVTAHRLPRR